MEDLSDDVVQARREVEKARHQLNRSLDEFQHHMPQAVAEHVRDAAEDVLHQVQDTAEKRLRLAGYEAMCTAERVTKQARAFVNRGVMNIKGAFQAHPIPAALTAVGLVAGARPLLLGALVVSVGVGVALALSSNAVQDRLKAGPTTPESIPEETAEESSLPDRAEQPLALEPEHVPTLELGIEG